MLLKDAGNPFLREDVTSVTQLKATQQTADAHAFKDFADAFSDVVGKTRICKFAGHGN